MKVHVRVHTYRYQYGSTFHDSLRTCNRIRHYYRSRNTFYRKESFSNWLLDFMCIRLKALSCRKEFKIVISKTTNNLNNLMKKYSSLLLGYSRPTVHRIIGYLANVPNSPKFYLHNLRNHYADSPVGLTVVGPSLLSLKLNWYLS